MVDVSVDVKISLTFLNENIFLVNAEGRKLSRMASPATPQEVNNNLDATEDEENEGLKIREIICEIAPQVTYAGEGLEPLVKDCKIKVPATQIGL